MDQSGLGNLAILPREISGRIFELVASSFEEPFTYLDEGVGELVRLEPLLSISQCFCRELLEAYLRVQDVKASGGYAWLLTSYIDSIVPLANPILHSRGIGVVQESDLPGREGSIFMTFKSYQLLYVDPSRWIPRRLNALRHCYKVNKIPAQPLYIDIDYGPSFKPLVSASLASELSQRVHQCTYPRCRATVYVADERTSTNELEKAIKDMRTEQQDIHASVLGLPDDVLPQASASRTAVQRSADSLEATLACFRELHGTVMRSVLEGWKEKDDFDEYCLDEFFKVVEAWVVS